MASLLRLESPILLLMVLLALLSWPERGGAVDTCLPPADIHVLAIGVCPPWQPEPGNCAENVSLFVDTLVDFMQVPRVNVHTVLCAQATLEGVRRGFDRLRETSTGESGVIVYFNGHGVILPVGRDGRLHEEVFCLWSEEYPFAGIYAVMAGIWMRAGEFAELLNSVPARAKVMIADTCHAGEIWDELPEQTKIEYGLEGAALLAAARAGGYALSGPKHTIFTQSLCKAMRGGAKNLRQAFEIAQPETTALSRPLCTSHSLARATLLCTEQIPTINDPGQVTPLFCLQ